MEENILKSYLILQLTTAKKHLLTIGPEADIEALHRFRVALRRFRSVLAAYTKNVYAPDVIAKSMLKATNPLREIDVFLDSVDPEAYPELSAALTKYRKRLYAKKWNPSKTKRFGQTIDALVHDLSMLKLNVSKKRLIKKGETLYRKAKKSHAALRRKSDDALIHQTRIMYKEARYVLEFLETSKLLNAKRKISKAKKTLDHFGAIQDAVNQLGWLHRFCKKHPSGECRALYAARQKVLKKLKKAFEV